VWGGAPSPVQPERGSAAFQAADLSFEIQPLHGECSMVIA
jgi:hypothetical protein